MLGNEPGSFGRAVILLTANLSCAGEVAQPLNAKAYNYKEKLIFPRKDKVSVCVCFWV